MSSGMSNSAVDSVAPRRADLSSRRSRAVDRDDGGPIERFEEHATHWHPAAAVGSIALMGYAAMSAVLIGVGLLITHQFGSLTRWDESVNRWFVAHRTASWNDWTGNATKIADTLGILVVLLLAALVLFLLKHRWQALILLLALSLEFVTFLTVNYIVDRPRPSVKQLGSLPSTSSFPSGHTAATIALYGGLAFIISSRLRSRIAGFFLWAFAVLLAAAIGLGRIYRGMHHPTDVIAGALMGLAALGVAVVAVRIGQAAAERRRHHTHRQALDPEVAA
jgi:membrane-associated phospholipid phosphatase